MITVANLLASNLNELGRVLCATLQSSLDVEVRFAGDATLNDFREGRIGLTLVCGLAYSLLGDAEPDRFVPVAAPVVADDRSGGRAVYFSEIVVPVSSTARTLDDLSGVPFAYNEEVSFSGYRALEHELRGKGSSWSLFSECIRTGSHRGSLDSLTKGSAEAAAIDSHVLLLEKRRDPVLADGLRTVASLGPYPSPPLAVNTGVCDVSPEPLHRLLDRLPADTLRNAGIKARAAVDDASYDAIRTVTRDLPDLQV